MKYPLILADPPWRYNDQGTRLSPAYEGKQRKSGKRYAWPVIKAWGFKYSTAIPWVKARWDERQQRFIFNIGGGKTTRSCSEELLVCTRGRGASLVKDRGIPGAIIAPARRGHSGAYGTGWAVS